MEVTVYGILTLIAIALALTIASPSALAGYVGGLVLRRLPQIGLSITAGVACLSLLVEGVASVSCFVVHLGGSYDARHICDYATSTIEGRVTLLRNVTLLALLAAFGSGVALFTGAPRDDAQSWKLGMTLAVAAVALALPCMFVLLMHAGCAHRS